MIPHALQPLEKSVWLLLRKQIEKRVWYFKVRGKFFSRQKLFCFLVCIDFLLYIDINIQGPRRIVKIVCHHSVYMTNNAQIFRRQIWRTSHISHWLIVGSGGYIFRCVRNFLDSLAVIYAFFMEHSAEYTNCNIRKIFFFFWVKIFIHERMNNFKIIIWKEK